jgi:hypothetical protein
MQTTIERNAARRKAVASALTIDGWLSEREACELYDLARDAKGPIIEIGSWKGRSTAALALGSMDGGKHPVYAIDSFGGVGVARFTDGGEKPTKPTTPEQLRANLDAVGVNGLVKIIPFPSREAVDKVPNCSVLFVDGDHSYEGAAGDIDAYFPKVLPGGTIMLHDVTEGDPGVVQAVDEKIMTRPHEYSVKRRVDSAIVVKKQASQKLEIVLGFPGRPSEFGAVRGLLHASVGIHSVHVLNSRNGWDDFNFLWAEALNLMEQGRATHFAMLHTDICPAPGWIDTLVEEMDTHGADLVSTIMPIKDTRGVTSTGIGDARDPWKAFRRYTVREVLAMPDTFSIADTEYANDATKHMLHNTGCWVTDLRNPAFRAVDENGFLRCWFDFPTRIARNAEGKWQNARESEDWFFSRKIAEFGLKTFATRKVTATHVGDAHYTNFTEWGDYKNGDEDTAPIWRPKG